METTTNKLNWEKLSTGYEATIPPSFNQKVKLYRIYKSGNLYYLDIFYINGTAQCMGVGSLKVCKAIAQDLENRPIKKVGIRFCGSGFMFMNDYNIQEHPIFNTPGMPASCLVRIANAQKAEIVNGRTSLPIEYQNQLIY